MTVAPEFRRLSQRFHAMAPAKHTASSARANPTTDQALSRRLADGF